MPALLFKDSFSPWHLIVVLAILLSIGCTRVTEGEKEIREVLRRLNQAYVEQDEEALTAMLDSETVRWYRDAIDGSMNDTLEDLENRPTVQIILILRIRSYFKQHQLNDISMVEVFKMSTDGLLPSHYQRWTLSDLNIEGNIATAGIVENGNSQSIYFVSKEHAWKFNMTTVFESENYALDEIILDSNKKRMDWILSFLWALGVDNVDPSMLNPPGKETEADPASGGESRKKQ